jgi:enoyl-CoA hydratase/carnithine racemase
MATRAAPAADVVATRHPGGLLELTLSRPAALNALDERCVTAVHAAIVAGPAPKALLLRGCGPRPALCAGGDVRAIRQAALDDPVPASASTPWPAPPAGHACETCFQAEYNLLPLLTPPSLTIMDGVAMGLGAGLAAAAGAGAGGVRVATGRTLWAMPEAAVGLFPDVGFAAWGLAAGLSARAVLALGLGGGRLAGAEVVRAGLATHLADPASLPSLIDAVRALDFNAPGVDAAAALRRAADAVALPVGDDDDGAGLSSPLRVADDSHPLAPALDTLAAWRRRAGGARLSDAVLGFRAAVAAAAAAGAPAAADLHAGLAAACPVSAAVWVRLATDAAEAAAGGRPRALADQLAAELPPAARLAVSPHFEAGVRSVLVERRGAPEAWPEPLAPTDADVDALLAPLPGGGLDPEWWARGGARR